MTISIGVDYTPEQWRVCGVDQGKPVELHTFATAGELLALVRQICALYPEPTIVVSLEVTTPFSALPALTDEQIDRLVRRYHPTQAFIEAREVLRSLRSMSMRSYCAPSVEYLPTVPLYRRLMRPALGTANEVCATVALLHHMREQDASWPEMNFFTVNASENGSCALVIKDGEIINGIGTLQGSSLPAAYRYLTELETAAGPENGKRRETFRRAFSEAFWEGLTQELAGLIAIHHIEDIVVLGKESASLIERLADIYQVYLFPHAHTEREGYEAALGAALLAEGLEQDSSARDVVNRLQIRQADQAALVADL